MSKRAKQTELNTDTHKFCYMCRTLKERSSYSKNKSRYDGLNSECKACRTEKKRNALYQLGKETYATMRKEQNNLCAICGKPSIGRRLAVDHDHTTGKVRGLLCKDCNLGLGFFKDDITALASAIEYLKNNI